MAKVFSDFGATKLRNVACIMYLDDWGISYGSLLAWLDDLHMPCACSPVHNRDRYTELDVAKWLRDHSKDDGSIDKRAIDEGVPRTDQQKKDHVHVLLCSGGALTAAQWAEKFEGFHDVNYFLRVNSVPSMLRYFAHMDSPDKAQYSSMDVHGFGGIDLSPLLQTDKVSSLHTLVTVMHYIKDNKVKHYNRLVKYAVKTGDLDLINCVTGRAPFFAAYFKSEADERRIMRNWQRLMKKYPEISEEELRACFV